LTFDTPTATEIVKKNLGDEAVEELKVFGSEFQAFPDLEEAVKNDVTLLKESKLIPDSIKISGWVYAVETGKVKRVVG